MAAEFHLHPTHAEAEALASLVTTSSSEPLNGIQYFHELLRALRDPAFSTFLFASDPIELQHLVHPQLPQFSVTNEMHEINVEPNAIPQNSLSDKLFSRQFSFPAFSSEGKTYGFTISKDIYAPGSAWGVGQTVVDSINVSRFVKHNEEGYTVNFVHYEDFNAYRLEYTKMLTNTQQMRFVAVVDAKQFQRIRQQGSLSVKDVIPALFLTQMSVEHRECPDYLHSAEECYCAASLVKPRHPFDFDAFRKSAMDRGGVFEGRTAMTLFGAGVKIRSGTLGTRFVLRPKYDFDIVEGLRRLAINKHVGGETARHSNIFTDAARKLRPVQIGNEVHPSTETTLGNSFLSNIGTVTQTADLTTEPYGLNYLLPPRKGEEENSEVSDLNIIPSLIDSVIGPSAGLEAPLAIMNIPEGGTAGVQLMDISTQIDSLRSNDQAPSLTGESVDDEGQPVGTESLSLAKRNEEKSTSDIQIKRLKAELRKERNRACAQRSNMRKKAMMDALKTDIRTTREKAELLRSKEMLLRSQNILLKKQVADKLVTEPPD